MPFFKEIKFSHQTMAYVWKITEEYDQLRKEVSLSKNSILRLEKMKAENHQKGYLAIRMLLQHLDYTDFDLEYDLSGKPSLKSKIKNQKSEISISHSGEFSVIALSQEKIGIDLEKMKQKVLRIAPRFMNMKHLENLHVLDQIRKSTVIWGIKESIFKIKNETGISFPEHIFEHEFDLVDKKCTAELHFNNFIEKFDLEFDFIEDYALVCGFRQQN